MPPACCMPYLEVKVGISLGDDLEARFLSGIMWARLGLCLGKDIFLMLVPSPLSSFMDNRDGCPDVSSSFLLGNRVGCAGQGVPG
jgi:hypothetical protein